MDETTFVIKTFVQTFEKENKVVVKKHEIEDQMIKTERNFCSGILRLKIEYDDGTQNLYKKVLLKIPILGVNYDMTKDSNVYDKEIYIYQVVLPRMYKFWSGKRLTPKFYAATALKSLILEDLSESGFKMVDKKTRLDLEHSKIALRSLAQFHALSLKYLQTYDIDEAKMNHSLSNLTDLEAQNIQELILFPLYDSFLKISSTLVSKNMYKILEEYKNHIHKETQLTMNINKNGMNVMRHGDYSIGNILFRYDTEGRVLESKMIDFQLTSISSPSIDLIYFFVSSVQTNVYEKYRNQLFDIYLNVLNDTLSSYKFNQKYTKNDLTNDMKTYKKYYLFVIGITLKFIMSDSSQFSDVLNTKSKEYVLVVQEWLNYLDREDLL
ncbi:hypothetical protein PGB90_001728 [Kerria lacca]